MASPQELQAKGKARRDDSGLTGNTAQGRAMMQQWADYLDKLKAGAEVIPLRSNKAKAR